MSIDNFDGNTFVAYLDISGFKKMMKQKDKAWKALDKLYSTGYDVLKRQHSQNSCKVDGFFISDKGILFVRNDCEKTKRLHLLLQVVKEINQKLLKNDFMLTTSIAYGKFKYQERIEFPGIQKNPIYGNAYVAAFLDCKHEKPKIQPGQCRIVAKNLPDSIVKDIKLRSSDYFRAVESKKKNSKHYYYYWMVSEHDEISNFKKEYKNACNLKFKGMLDALKGVNRYH